MKGPRGLITRVLVRANAQKHTKEGVNRGNRPSDLSRVGQIPQGGQREVECRGSREGNQSNPLEDVVGLVRHLFLLEVLSHLVSSLREVWEWGRLVGA